MVFLRGRLGRPTAKKFDFAGADILGIDFEEYVSCNMNPFRVVLRDFLGFCTL